MTLDPSPTVTITDADDPRLEPYRGLKDRELARQGDCFIAEGEFIVRRLLASGLPVVSVLVGRTRWESLTPPLTIAPATEVYLVDDDWLAQIVGYKFHLGMLAIGRRPPSLRVDDLAAAWAGQPQQPRTLLAAADIINHENVGSLLRIAAGLGADALLLGERCCDPYWRRSIRVSMGTIFSLPLVRSHDLAADLRRLHDAHGFATLATVLSPQAVPLRQIHRPLSPDRPDRLVLLVGNEAKGLPRDLITLADRQVMIPMHHGTDSLNLAIAAAICLHHLVPPTQIATNRYQ